MKRRDWIAAGMMGLMGCARKDEGARENILDTAGEQSLSYRFELEGDGMVKPVGVGYGFRSGDRFRVVVKPGFQAHVYLLGRGVRSEKYTLLFPGSGAGPQNPLEAGKEVRIPGEGGGWIRMDEKPGEESLVLVAATESVEERLIGDGNWERAATEERLARVERALRPGSSRRFEDGEWVRLFGYRKGAMTLVERVWLAHE